SAGSVAENQPAGTLVGTLSTTDPDAGDHFSYTLVGGPGGADNAAFALDAGGQLRTATGFDFEAKASYAIRVKSTDAGGLSVEQAFTVGVTDVNEAPTDIALDNRSVAETQPPGTLVGALRSTDPDVADGHTYRFAGGADDAFFRIVGDQLRTAAGFDFEARSSYRVRVRSTDAGGLSVERDFTIVVTDVNEAPPGGGNKARPLTAELIRKKGGKRGRRCS